MAEALEPIVRWQKLLGPPSAVVKALERMLVNRATHPEINGTDIIKRPAVMTPKEITTPPPPQHRTQRGERALQQLESTYRVCMLQLLATK